MINEFLTHNRRFSSLVRGEMKGNNRLVLGSWAASHGFVNGPS